jgi:hypothetical protein
LELTPVATHLQLKCALLAIVASAMLPLPSRGQSQVATSTGSGVIYYTGSDNTVHQMFWGGSQ